MTNTKTRMDWYDKDGNHIKTTYPTLEVPKSMEELNAHRMTVLFDRDYDQAGSE